MSPVRSGNLAAERIRMIKEQQEAFSKKGQKTVLDDNEPPVRSGNLAAERIRMIKEQQQAFSKKGQSPDRKHINVGSGNLAAERMRMIREQQEAFANKGKKVDEEKEESDENETELSGVKGAASKFGDVVKPKSAVQRRKEEFERQQKEAAMKNDPKAHQVVSWKNGSAHGQFKKTAQDSRGIATKKSLSDLP